MIICLTFFIHCEASMKTSKQSGREWGQKGASSAFDEGKKMDANMFLAPELRNTKFDVEQATQDVKNRVTPKSETLDFITSQEVQNNMRRKGFHEDELFMKRSEEIFANAGKESTSEFTELTGYTLHTCQQAGDPFLISTERTLNVKVNQIQRNKICLGHKKHIKVRMIGDFEKSIRELKEKYTNDPSIDPQSVEITLSYTNPLLFYYNVTVSYKHINNAESCHRYKKKKFKNESFRETEDEWLYDNEEMWNLAKSPDSTILSHECLDASPTKIINEKSVTRQCWKEKISFLYQFPSTNDCNFLKQKNCEQIKQECVQSNSSGCTQWELTFRCFEGITHKYASTNENYTIDDEIIDYVPNQSFSEVAAKLAVFEEVKKEMEKSNLIDVTKLEIFTGKRMSCSKNVADNLIYDCCFKYSGLAKRMGMSKCNADEIGLAEMREQGLCHYVGSYEEKFLNMWKSRDEHVFCCYPSKLSRIVQEEGRKQLKMNFGEPKEPNCRGFTPKELSSLNFSEMDLSEICKDFARKLPDDMPDRLQAFQNRLQHDIEEAEVKR
jgi:conjugal transfer mating pair stabilization protein TraN